MISLNDVECVMNSHIIDANQLNLVKSHQDAGAHGNCNYIITSK